MRRTIFLLSVVGAVLAMHSGPALAAPGELDAAFDKDGKVTANIGTGTSDSANAVAVQKDGKTVAAGTGNNGDFALARFNPDGTPDLGFGPGGKRTVGFGDGANDAAQDVAVQADGKIVVAGISATAQGSAAALARYNPDGTLDTSFDPAERDGKVTTANLTVDALALQPDGKIVVGGTSCGREFAAARYNPDGSPDIEFDGDGIACSSLSYSYYYQDPDASFPSYGERWTTGADDVAVQESDGKIVVVGTTKSRGYGWASVDPKLYRFNADGSQDVGFDSPEVPGHYQEDYDGSIMREIALAVQPDGKIVTAGGDYRNSGPFVLTRHNADGSADAGFEGDGVVRTNVGSANSHAKDVVIRPDGKIVAAGSSDAGSGNLALARYNADGSLDRTFSNDGQLTTDVGSGSNDAGEALSVQADGKLVAAGRSGGDFALARYRVDNLPAATAIGVTPSASVVPYDGSVSLSGRLTASSDPMGSKTLTVWRSADARAWTKVATAAYDPAQKAYKFTATLLKSNAYFQLRFAGDSSLKPSASAPTLVKAQASLSTPVTPGVVKKGVDFTTYGYLKPYHPGYTRLDFYRFSFGKWTFYKSASAPNASYNGYAKYALRYKLPYAGDWYVKAYHADSSHAPTWSQARYFLVQ